MNEKMIDARGAAGVQEVEASALSEGHEESCDAISVVA